MQGASNNTKKNELLTHLILYISHHYPQTSSLLDKVLATYLQHASLFLCETIDKIFLSVIKIQYIYGSSFSSRNVEDLPKEIHQDMSLVHHEKFNKIVQFREEELSFNLIPKQRINELLWYNLQEYLYIGAKLKCTKDIKKILSVQGEQWIQSSKFSSLFAVLRKCYDQIQKTMKSQMPTDTMICHARLAFLQSKILSNPTKMLCDIVLKTYRQSLEILQQKAIQRSKYLQIMLQYSYALLFFYKYSASSKAITLCQQILNLSIEYTGVLGRRTKYQSFDTAQLIMKLRDQAPQAKKQDITNIFDEELQQQKIKLPNPKQLVLKQTERISEFSGSIKNIEDIKYDEDNILMDVPPYLKQSTQSIQSQITPQKQLTILAAIHHMWINFPRDDLLYQQISTSINTLLLGSSEKKMSLDYGVRFCLLALRSFNEFPRVKNVERALQQLQKLVDQYKNGQKISSQVFALPYEPHLRFIINVGDKLMQVGLSMSAVQLLQQAGMYEQCADALIKRNYKQKALQIIDRLVKEKGQTPRLLCMKGDACKQESQEFYIKAWKVSEEKYPRAQKSLGWHHFSQKKYDKAAQAFQKSLIISYYQPSTWFTLGCCYMYINQTKKALKAFGQTICIDDTQGEAWGNMASCYLKEGKIQEAYATLQKAVKHSYNSWKMWSNLLSVSLRVKQFYKYSECIEKIAKMDHKEIITNEVLAKLTSILAFKLQTSNRKMICYSYVKRITLVFKNIASVMGQMGIYWKNYSLFHQELLNYHKALYEHFKEKADPNDPVPGYITPQQAQKTYTHQIIEIKKRIVESKQTELNMQMCVGWQENKLTGEKVKKVLEEYEQIYQEYSDKTDLNQYHLFISGVKKKLEFCFSDK